MLQDDTKGERGHLKTPFEGSFAVLAVFDEVVVQEQLMCFFRVIIDIHTFPRSSPLVPYAMRVLQG